MSSPPITMPELVSVIIPCFNAERWLTESIDSCLNQTYANIEIIVIDDGSTDSSLDVIKSYGGKVCWESGPNRGGNYARNRGFALSQGQYIQYLDADDYLLPEKIAKQVMFLEETRVDTVYGDWRYRYHEPDGQTSLGKVREPGAQVDILESMLAAWWFSPACILFRRAIIEKSDGWDESLRAGQDRDFFLALVMNGAKFAYQPGCDSVYRRYGNVTVSTAVRSRFLESYQIVLEKAEYKLSQEEKLSMRYKCALAKSYFYLARQYLNVDPARHPEMVQKVLNLHPTFQAEVKKMSNYSMIQKLLGFQRTEWLFSKIYGRRTS